MEDKLILLERNNPTSYEVHRYEILQSKNLVLTTTDKCFAMRLVDNYNKNNTERLQVAAMAMQGILANKEYNGEREGYIAKLSAIHADALINKINEIK